MKISGQNGQQQYLVALVKCLIDVRLWKTFSVHIRRPAASSYWKSNWSDTCIFELNEPGFSSPSLWSRRDAISNLTNVRLKIFNSASFNVLFELDEPGFLSPLILRRADPADTQSRIWCTSGTDSRSESQVQAKSDRFTGGQNTSDTGWPPTWKPFCRKQSS